MKNYISICLLSLSLGFYSCKKDGKTEPDFALDNQPTATESENYSALKAGNYWIYERFEVDEFGNSTSLNIIDSCYIEKDTIINGKQYFKYIQPNLVSGNPTLPPTENVIAYIYDSSSYIIPYPRINYTPYSYLDTTYIIGSGIQFSGTDTLYSVKVKMTDKNMMFTIPAGTFKTINEKATYTFPNSFLSCNQKTRSVSLIRAENIGIVFQDYQFFHSLCKHWDRRLIRYHVVL